MAPGSSRTPPLLLFRGDSRHPDIIFKDGFVAKGGLDGVVDLLSHVAGGEKLKQSGLISTSQSLRIPPIFMDFVPKEGGYDTKIGPDRHDYIKRFGWIYQIKPTSDLKMDYIPDFLGDNHPDLKPLYNYQQEWAVYYSIPPKNIKGAQRFEGYVRNQDLLDGRGPFTISLPDDSPYHEWDFHDEEEGLDDERHAFVAGLLRGSAEIKDLCKDTRVRDDILRMGSLEKCSAGLVTMHKE